MQVHAVTLLPHVDNEMIMPLGDFNLIEGDPVHEQGLDKMRVGFRNSCEESSDPSCHLGVNLEFHTARVVDYIWLRKGTFPPYAEPWIVFNVRNNEAINDPIDVSDHLPIIGTFKLIVDK